MKNYWIVKGDSDNWRLALAAKGIWGLKDQPLAKVYWLAIAPGDTIFFYVTGNVKGVVGYGTVRAKFHQTTPLFADEIKAERVLWPLRFEFDVDYLLPDALWDEACIRVPGGGQFRQPLIPVAKADAEANILKLNPSAVIQRDDELPAPKSSEPAQATHTELQNLIAEVGRLQAYLANTEFPMGNERLDVVWRRLPESVPTYAFEVQVGGDVYHALGKLKHAYDLWNSRIFLVAEESSIGQARQLLLGTFHEIQPVVRIIDSKRMLALHRSKKAIYDIEREMGIIP